MSSLKYGYFTELIILMLVKIVLSVNISNVVIQKTTTYKYLVVRKSGAD